MILQLSVTTVQLKFRKDGEMSDHKEPCNCEQSQRLQAEVDALKQEIIALKDGTAHKLWQAEVASLRRTLEARQESIDMMTKQLNMARDQKIGDVREQAKLLDRAESAERDLRVFRAVFHDGLDMLMDFLIDKQEIEEDEVSLEGMD